MADGEIEEIKSTPKEKEVHWKIPDNFYYLYSKMKSQMFRFLGVNWQLKMNPYDDDTYKDYKRLHLQMNNENISCNVLCTFGIKKNDGSLITLNLLHHTFNKHKPGLTYRNFLHSSILSQRKSELTSSNKFTVVCNMKQLDDPVNLTDLNALSENLKGLLTDREFCDVTFNVMDTEFKAHRNILAARSSVFASMFKHETSEKLTGIVNITDCNPESFQVFIEYLYSGKLENISFKNVFDVHKIADKYDVQELKMLCILYMERNLKVENVCDVVAFAEEHDEKMLFGIAQGFFNRNAKKILANDNWETFSKNNFSLTTKLLIEMVSNVNFETAMWQVP